MARIEGVKGMQASLVSRVLFAQISHISETRPSRRFAIPKTPPDVSDGLFEGLQEHFSSDQLVELVTGIAQANFRGRFNRTFHCLQAYRKVPSAPCRKSSSKGSSRPEKPSALETGD